MEHQNAQQSDRPRRRKSVPYSDAIRFGLIAGVVTFLVVAITTQGSSFATEGLSAVSGLGQSAIYGGIAFAVATLLAIVMNMIAGRSYVDDEITEPVLH